MMRFTYTFPVATLAVCAVSLGTGMFEPQDFNVTAALENIGVDVSTLPEHVSGLIKRSLAPCSLAVCLMLPYLDDVVI